MNLKPAEEWTKLENCPFDERHRIRLYRQIQANALRWAGQRLQEEDTKLDAYYDIIKQANQLDPKPKA